MYKFLVLASTAVVAGVVLATPAAAQASGTIGSAELESAVTASPAVDDQAVVQRWLKSDRVAAAARSMGTDAGDLASRAAALDPSSMRNLAEQARADEQQLAGGDQKVIISTTAIIIGLLILILLTT